MSDPHVLFCAFAEVPGASAVGTRTGQWLSVFGSREVDALTLKGREAAHIQRLGGARMMRVPNTSGKPFLERLSTYQRALQRQLASDQYELVWCADLFSGAVVAQALKEKIPIVVEIGEVPSQSIAGRQLVGEDTAVVQKRWREQERLAIRAATKVLLPSRNAAKLLSERIDPRILQVVPRSVDRTVFVPPSVEIALDDDRRVVIFGGREGGAALRASVAIAQALAQRVPANVAIGLLGQPSLADAEVRAALAKKSLSERVDLVDADGPLAVTAALSLAHVVVVPSSAEEESEPFGIPHRALEAMSCGRAVIVTGPDGAFRDAAVPGEHFVCAPPRDPQATAEAVLALLEDGGKRDAVARAAARHMERTADLAVRAADVRAMINEATSVELRLHAPRGDDPDTSSKSVPPPTPSMLQSQVAKLAADSGKVAMATAAAPVAAQPRGPAPAPTRAPPAARSASGPNPMAPAGGPMPTVRMDMPSFGTMDGGGWEGDTFLDGGVPPILETSPDAARVRAAMLVSSDAQSKAESSVPTSPPTSVPSGAPASVPTSIIVQAALDSKPPSSPSDPWAPDTIADGTPIETRGADPSVLQRAASSGPKKSFLVDAAANLAPSAEEAADLTAEDQPPTTSSSDEDPGR